jgi:hypothetical protein
MSQVCCSYSRLVYGEKRRQISFCCFDLPCQLIMLLYQMSASRQSLVIGKELELCSQITLKGTIFVLCSFNSSSGELSPNLRRSFQNEFDSVQLYVKGCNQSSVRSVATSSQSFSEEYDNDSRNFMYLKLPVTFNEHRMLHNVVPW